MDIVQQVALAAGLAWGSGIRVYAVVFLAGLLGYFGYLQLPLHLQVLEHPLVLGVAGAMLTAEFLADKLPAFDSAWDAVHTFIRVPAGALLAAAALGEMDPVWVAVAALTGGAVASTAHLTKAGGRALINASPEPFSNWMASLAEDFAVPVGFSLAVLFPWVFLGLLLLFLAVVAWFLPFLWRGLRALLRRRSGSPA